MRHYVKQDHNIKRTTVYDHVENMAIQPLKEERELKYWMADMNLYLNKSLARGYLCLSRIRQSDGPRSSSKMAHSRF